MLLTGCSESGRYRVGTTLIESDLWSKYRADGLRVYGEETEFSCQLRQRAKPGRIGD